MSRSKHEQAQATRQKLERTARKLFETRGFDSVSAEEIVAEAGVTRGALYHHYDGKEGLFEAVLESAMRELHAELVKAARGAADPVEGLRAGIAEYLRVCSEPRRQRILLIDGPAVLGWHRWREMDAGYGLGLLNQGLAAALGSRRLRAGDVELLAHLLLGAVTEAAMVLARSAHPRAERRHAERALNEMIQSWTGEDRTGHRAVKARSAIIPARSTPVGR